MGGPERDTEIEAAAEAIKDAGTDDQDKKSPEAAEPAEGVEKGDTPGIGSVHGANADGVNPDS